ncbi:Uncharacterised protein [Bordetella ansorpii]|uniref:Lipoprotein n=1 Tax=Bordetella ansorpii TaxID=288768 RepID=A0A157PM42_9BORD|nr:hypothetical protein [Bordetella ansorpii]SAI34438.1 Uncharacterised protein [Bordetella ansorpii]
MHSTKRDSPRRQWLAVLGLSIAMLVAGATQPTARAASSGPDDKQATAPGSTESPVAYLQANTGGDSMLAEKKSGYALEVHVLDGSHAVKEIARCARISSGNALGGGTERELQVAICEGDERNRGEYWLISEPGVVSVRKGPIGTEQQMLLEHRLQNSKARAIAKAGQ